MIYSKCYIQFKHIDNADKEILSEQFISVPDGLKNSFVKSTLEKHWDTYLSMYEQNEFSYHQNKQYSFFLLKNVSCYFDYLFIAQSVHWLCHKEHLKFLFRHLMKCIFSDIYFIKDLLNRSWIESLFLRWLIRLWMEQFNQYMESYIVYLCQSSWMINVNFIKFHKYKNVSFVEFKDLLVFKLYNIRSQLWCLGHGIYRTDQKVDELSQLKANDTSLCHIHYDLHLILKKKKTNQIIFLSNLFFDNQQNVLKLPQRKYKFLLKQLIEINKGNRQIDLVKKINQVIKIWERSPKMMIQKHCYKKNNNVLLQFLWRWAKNKHSGKTYAWIKQRYWNFFNDGFFFQIENF